MGVQQSLTLSWLSSYVLLKGGAACKPIIIPIFTLHQQDDRQKHCPASHFPGISLVQTATLRVAREAQDDAAENPFWWCDPNQAGYGFYLVPAIKEWCSTNA